MKKKGEWEGRREGEEERETKGRKGGRKEKRNLKIKLYSIELYNDNILTDKLVKCFRSLFFTKVKHSLLESMTFYFLICLNIYIKRIYFFLKLLCVAYLKRAFKTDKLVGSKSNQW